MAQGVSLPSAILNGPALKPPPGEIPDFENGWNNNEIARITNALCLLAVIAATLVRVYVRAFCMKKIQVEDSENPAQPPETEKRNC